MSLERIDICHAAVAVLKAALPELGGRVEPNRTLSYENWELPAITIFTTGEEVELEEQGPRRYLRKAELVVQIATAELGAIDDTLAALEDKVVQTLEASDDLNQTAGRLQLTAVRGPAIDDEGRQPLAHTSIVYQAWYRYAAPRAHPSAEQPLREVSIQIDSTATRTGPEIEGKALPEQE